MIPPWQCREETFTNTSTIDGFAQAHARMLSPSRLADYKYDFCPLTPKFGGTNAFKVPET